MATFKDGIDWLDDHMPFFLTLVLNLGKPTEDKNIPTAEVRCPTDSPDDFVLAYNPDYFATCTAEEVGGVLGHEALHAILGHLGEVGEPYTNAKALVIAHELICNDRLSNEGFTLPGNPYYGPETVDEDCSPYPTEEVYELVVAKLEENQQEQNSDAGDSDEQDASDSQDSGQPQSSSDEGDEGDDEDKSDTSGENAGDSSSDDSSEGDGTDPAEDDSEGDGAGDSGEGTEKADNGSESDSDGSSSSGAGDGADSDEIPGEAVCGHSHKVGSGPGSGLSEAEAEALKDKLMAVAEASNDLDTLSDELRSELNLEDGRVEKSEMAGAGGGFATAEQAAVENNVSVQWMKLLAEVNPDILRKPGKSAAQYRSSWHAPRRKLAHMGNKVMVPNYIRKGDVDRNAKDGNNKPSIVLALDLSFSIPRYWAKRMIEIAQSIPTDLIDVKCCTFSTVAIPFDHTSDRNQLAHGGTDFSCIEDFIQNEVTQFGKLDYPKSVVVITDGVAYFNTVQPAHLDNWTWLLIEDGHQVHDDRVSENIHKLDAFM